MNALDLKINKIKKITKAPEGAFDPSWVTRLWMAPA